MNNRFVFGFFSKAVYFVLLVAPVVGYAVVVGLLSYNLPIFDDYILLLEVANLVDTPNWGGKISILFGQLNEHRLAYTRFWFWLMTGFDHGISFKSLIWIGNASLLGIGVLLYRQGRRLAVPATVWLPIGWLLFQFQFYVNSLWAMASLQNLTVHFLYLLLFTLIVRPGRVWFISACLTAVVLVYTSGNGFIGPVLTVPVLIYQRRYRQLGLWLLLLLALSAAYFLDYQPVQSLQANGPIPVTGWLFGVLLFLGLVAKVSMVPTLLIAGIGAGLLLTASALTILSIRQLWLRDPERRLANPAHALMVICILTYGFLAISAVAVVHGRWAFGGWQAVLEVRYCLYSTLWLITVYGHTVAILADTNRVWRWQPAVWVVSGLSVAYWALTVEYNLAGMYEFRDRALSDYFNWTQTKLAEQQRQTALVFRPSGREAQNLARIRQRLVPADSPTHRPTRTALRGLSIRSESRRSHSEIFAISGLQPGKTRSDWRYLVLRSTNQVLLMPVLYQTNTRFETFWLEKRWFGTNWTAEANTFFTQKQPYQIGLLTNDGGQIGLRYSNKYLRP